MKEKSYLCSGFKMNPLCLTKPPFTTMTKNAYLFTMAAHATFSVLNDKLLCESYRKAYDRRLAAHPKEYITFYRFLFLTFYRKAVANYE